MPTSKETIDNPDKEVGGYNFTYPWKFWTKQNFSPGKSAQLCYTDWKFQHQKPRSLETPHVFFLIYSFLTNSENSKCLFL